MCVSSALTLCLSFVSALDITVPVEVYAGTSVALNVGTDPSDPSYIGLSLVSDEVYVELVADVAVAPTIYVDIPESIFPGWVFSFGRSALIDIHHQQLRDRRLLCWVSVLCDCRPKNKLSLTSSCSRSDSTAVIAQSNSFVIESA